MGLAAAARLGGPVGWVTYLGGGLDSLPSGIEWAGRPDDVADSPKSGAKKAFLCRTKQFIDFIHKYLPWNSSHRFPFRYYFVSLRYYLDWLPL